MVPPVTPPGSARDAALEAVRHVGRGGTLLRDELHALFASMALEPRDRALALQLAAGTVRHRRTLRLLVSHVRQGAGRASSIQPELLDILELGAFQLLFLDRVPAYAAVNEAVEQARRTARPGRSAKVAGFVNGVLRAIGRLVVGRDGCGSPARDALPHPDGGVVRLAEPVLPDPADGLAAFLGAAYSYPDWLVARWVAAYGDRAEGICRWGNRRPRTFARIQPTAAGTDAETNRLLAELPPGPRPATVDVSAVPLDRLLPLLERGVLTIQDPSAMAAVEALAPAPGESVLDLCAAPGTKTTQIVEAVGDCGRVVACDRSDDRLAAIRQTVAARGLRCVGVMLSSEAAAAMPTGGFDAALVDAPCSNTGVLARRPEARWRLRPADIDELSRLQRTLLEQAADLVRPGGRLVYSTCSLEAEENGAVVEDFLRSNPSWRLCRQELILPGPDCDGAFWALLDRRPV